MAKAQIDNTSHQPAPGSGFGALARIGWLVVGTVVIVSLTLAIASLPTWTLGVRDVLFWSATIGTGVLRYIDVTQLEGQTANGERATADDLRRYLIGLATIALVLWVSAQSISL